MKFLGKAMAVLLAVLVLAGCGSFVQEKSVQQEQAELERILDDLAENMRPGTAGSSLTSARITAELIGWASTAKMDKKEAGKIVLGWMQEQSPEIRAALQEKLDSVSATYGQVIRDGAADLMEAAGVEKDLSNLGSRAKDLIGEILASGGID